LSWGYFTTQGAHLLIALTSLLWQVQKVHTSVGVGIWFLNTRWFWVFQKTSKNCWASWKNWQNLMISRGYLMFFFKTFWEPWLYVITWYYLIFFDNHDYKSKSSIWFFCDNHGYQLWYPAWYLVGGLVQFLMIPAPLWFKSAPFKNTCNRVIQGTLGGSPLLGLAYIGREVSQ